MEYEKIKTNNSTNHMKRIKDKKLNEIIYDWNQTVTEYPRDSSAIKIFEETAAVFPNRIALRYKDEEITYKKLNEKANQLARYLQINTNMGRQKFICISMNKSIYFIVAVLAILKVNGIYVPLDADFPEDSKKHLIEDCNIDIIIIQKDLSDKFSFNKLKLICLDEMDLKLRYLNAENLDVLSKPDDIAYINYTSGSTGKPKGVLVPHRGIVRLVKNTSWIDITEKDRFLQAANIIFDATTLEVWGALLNGACICIYPYKKLHSDEMGEFLKKEGITHVLFSVKFFNLMVDNEIESLKGLRYLFSVGEAMSVNHAKKAFLMLKKTKVCNGYGPTENSTFTTTYTVTSLEDIEKEVPIGKPISNTFVYILDKKLNPLPIGEVGELYAGGDGVAKGYLNKKELTDEVFVRDPFRKDKRAKMYKTGDLACYQSDGNILFKGRKDSQVKIRGFRIELGAIELAVKRIKNVRECVCVVSEEIPGEKQLAIYVEVSGISLGELRNLISLELPQYLIPDFIIIMKSLPLTPTGKIDRKVLAHPRKILSEITKEDQSFFSIYERSILEIWKKILKLEKIDREDNFFNIGGNSINSVELMCLISEHLKMKIPPELIFEVPTLKDFSKKIEGLISTANKTEDKKKLKKDLFVRWRDQEIILDPAIGKEKLSKPNIDQFTDPKSVFLTGTTGLVGSFVLQMLLKETRAEVYCLVRARSIKEGFSRIKFNLEKYGIWEKEYNTRIIPIIGSLDKKLMGIDPDIFSDLAENIDSIFHVGANTNHMFSYNQLKGTNVQGTVEAIFLALHKKSKIFQFISTTDVFEAKGTLYEEDDLENSEILSNGYSQSKWVAEKIVQYARERGLQANIFRLSRILGSSINGSGPSEDLIWQTVQASVYLNALPDIEVKEKMEPVDFVAKAIIEISKKPTEINKEYHLFSDKSISLKIIFKALQSYGYGLKVISYEEWRKKLIEFCKENKKSQICALIPFYSEQRFSSILQEIKFDCKNANHALKKSFWPKIDDHLINLYINYYVRTGFLPKP